MKWFAAVRADVLNAALPALSSGMVASTLVLLPVLEPETK